MGPGVHERHWFHDLVDERFLLSAAVGFREHDEPAAHMRVSRDESSGLDRELLGWLAGLRRNRGAGI